LTFIILLLSEMEIAFDEAGLEAGELRGVIVLKDAISAALITNINIFNKL